MTFSSKLNLLFCFTIHFPWFSNIMCFACIIFSKSSLNIMVTFKRLSNSSTYRAFLSVSITFFLPLNSLVQIILFFSFCCLPWRGQRQNILILLFFMIILEMLLKFGSAVKCWLAFQTGNIPSIFLCGNLGRDMPELLCIFFLWFSDVGLLLQV